MPDSRGRGTVGVLGGMGPMGTVDFMARLVAATPVVRDQDHLHVIVDCDPGVPDRTDALVGPGAAPGPYLAGMAQRLQTAGADLLVMPCNTAHAFADAIEAAVSIPLIDWPGEAARAAAAKGWKRIGILASTGALRAELYQQRLLQLGAEPITPDEPAQAQVMDAIYADGGVKRAGPASPEAGERLAAAMRSLEERGADGVILACTELSAMNSAGCVPASLPAVDASQVAALQTVRYALGDSEHLPRRAA